MITIENRTITPGLSFAEYQALPGYSHSTFKTFGQPEPTDGMKLGASVDDILSGKVPKWFEKEARAIAYEMKRVMGRSLHHGHKQLAVQCDMRIGDLSMPYKGLIDFAIGEIVVDYKVLAGKDPDTAIDFFGYTNQLTGYALAYGAKIAYVVAFMKTSKKVEVRQIDLNKGAEFWQEKILYNGTRKS